MTEIIDYRIPPDTLRWLSEMPTDRPVVMLMRHSVRGHLPPNDSGYTVPITDVGERLGRELGAVLGGRLRALHASPLLRCVQTAEALRKGANAAISIRTDTMLGDPGVFVLDDDRAGALWRSHGHEAVMAHLVGAFEPWPGLATPKAAARFLVQRMFGEAGNDIGLHVFVTHDSLVTATAAQLLQIPLGSESWPWYLESAFFWRDRDCLHAAYRQHIGVRTAPLLTEWSEREISEFARREMRAVFGATIPARFFFCGGAFKTLLTGRRPRDLDIWAPSPEDRANLVAALLGRGAKELPRRPFGQAFQIAGRTVELPYKTTPPSLEERLGRFDIGLSAVGVEFSLDSGCRVVVHPLAVESLAHREVRLLLPLVNRQHALSTLERLRKYARELSFSLAAGHEDEVWRVFESQPMAIRTEMLGNLDLSGLRDCAVYAEAMGRLDAVSGPGLSSC